MIYFLRKVGLYVPLRWIARTSRWAFWSLYYLITRPLTHYQSMCRVYKLHIGCGTNYLEGWYNTDLIANHRRTRLDATKRFPYPDNTFDYIFSEHMIEHVFYDQGQAMLRECFRVLKYDGILRIATPDAKFLIDLYNNPDEPSHKLYIEMASKTRLIHGEPHNATSIINSYYRDWGHLYIYDVPTMKQALIRAGFGDLREYDVGESMHADLQGLEHADRMHPGFLALESMVVEATKPRSRQ